MEEKSLDDKKIHKIDKLEPVDTTKKIDLTKVIDTEEIAPSKMKFETALARADEVGKAKESVPVTRVEATQKPDRTLLSPIHEMAAGARKIERLEPATTERILDKAATIENKISDTRSLIASTVDQYPDIKIAAADESKLSENLVHVDATLRSSLSTVGAEVTSIEPVAAKGTPDVKSPLVTFLSYLTHGDKQMKSLIKEVSGMGTNTQLRPAQLLSIQIKLNFVQQEIEFFSSALNKALESAKTIMNVQI